MISPHFDETLQACGYHIRYYDAGYDEFIFDQVDTDLVVVLGGPIGAYEATGSHLAQTISLGRLEEAMGHHLIEAQPR